MMSYVTVLSRTLLPLLLSVASCATTPKRAPAPVQSQVPDALPPQVAQQSRERPPLPYSGLYTAREALIDVLAGQWTYLGTGRWPGSNRTHACAYHNGKVFIVDVYCTLTDSNAFRVDVLSPERGRLRIYAESNGPISDARRDDYFIFLVESEPPPAAGSWATSLTLSMSLAELQQYEALRYEAFLPACYVGVRHGEARGGCLDEYAPAAQSYRAEHEKFIDDPGAAYYQLVHILRKQAMRFGYDPL